MSNLNLQKLSELCTLYSGGTPSTSNESYWNGNLNWMSSGETSNKLIYGTKLKISEKGVAESSTRLAHSGDTVVATAGEGKTRGQTSYLLTDTYVNQSIVVLEADKTKIDNKFLFYAVSNSYNRMRALSDAAGIRGSLPCKLLNNFEINTFNLDIENKIGQFLFNIDLKIENNNKINAELESLAKTIYDYWFLQFEFPNEEGKPYKSSGGKMVWNEELKREIPEGWRKGSLSDICSITMGASPNGESLNENQNGLIFYQGKADFSFRFPSIRMFTTSPIRYAKKNDVLISVRAPVGDLNIANNDCCIGRGLAALHSSYPSYLYYKMVSSKNLFSYYNQNGTTFGAVTKENLHNLEIVVPNEKTIMLFEKTISPLDKKISILSQENQELSSLRDFLLPMLMNGQISFSDDI